MQYNNQKRDINKNNSIDRETERSTDKGNDKFADEKTVIGITGGIGSGKSMVIAFLKSHYPVEVILADEVGRELMDPGKAIYRVLREHYGESIIRNDGTIDRSTLAAIALKDSESQAEINRLEHPIIKEEIRNRIYDSECPVVFVEAALLFEGGLSELCDEIWYIRVKREIRIERLKAGRGYTRKKCIDFMRRQLSDREFMKRCTTVIRNDGDHTLTEQQLSMEMERVLKGKEGETT